jgi:hypothetical protein
LQAKSPEEPDKGEKKKTRRIMEVASSDEDEDTNATEKRVLSSLNNSGAIDDESEKGSQIENGEDSLKEPAIEEIHSTSGAIASDEGRTILLHFLWTDNSTK